MSRASDKPIRVLQVTDSHLGEHSDETLIGLRTADSLDDVLRRARKHAGDIDLVLATGDMSNDGTSGSYVRFIDAVKTFYPGTPLAWLPGNHDDPGGMKDVGKPGPITNYVELGEWRFILLNSRVPFEERGELHPIELKRLQHLLECNPGAPTMIFLHHQIVPVGSVWLDTYVVSNADEFFAITDRFDNIKAVSWGHVHQEYNSVRRGVDLLATPSTCVQFKPLSREFAIDSAMPGYRVYELFADGSYASAVSRIRQKNYAIDFASSGY